MSSRTVEVELGDRSYPIRIGRRLLDEPGVLDPWLAGDSAVLVTNDTVALLHGERARRAMGERVRVHECILPDGERYKTIETLQRVLDTAVDARCDRRCTVVALGGGVIGDIAGFAAAVYQRGVPFIQLPSTLLAQVDSSVGGKTGVNHPRGKNMIGAFHQPRCVIADTTTLDSLPQRELRAGLAEVIKYGLIGDAAFFEWLEDAVPSLLARDEASLAHAIEQSCRAKAAVVTADEHERDRRAVLNLGHTFGHAIETGTGYSGWLHGEAIAAGTCMAARLSHRMGRIGAGERQRIERLFEAAGLPTRGPGLPRERMRSLMAGDKKARGGRIRLVLLDGIGAARVSEDYDPALLDGLLGDEADAGAARA